MSKMQENCTVMINNLTIDNNNLHPISHSFLSDNDDDAIWVILLHKIQLVLTIIGFIANVVTSITLIKTGQVRKTIEFYLNNFR